MRIDLPSLALARHAIHRFNRVMSQVPGGWPPRIDLVIEGYDRSDFEAIDWTPTPGASVDYWMSVSIGPGDGSLNHFQFRVASPDAMNDVTPRHDV